MDITRQRRKHLQTSHALKQSFIELVLNSHEPDMVTISQITDKADFNRSTFYFHFKNKEELLEDMFNDALQGIYDAVKYPFIRNEKSYETDISFITSLLCNHIENNKRLFKSLAIMSVSPSLFIRMEKFIYRIFTNEFTFYKQADTQQLDYEISIIYHITSTVGVLRYWIASDFKYSSEYISKQLTLNHTSLPVYIKVKGLTE
ncbi:TetR/AcrR family transcriptional regulator [Paenibacillus illinoisensis]|uniref:TetR/AcrR family transcriptional regulator n=1 Tax=Paenibacillus illinoisensis TaxID=59845 RepID=UPI003D274B88